MCTDTYCFSTWVSVWDRFLEVKLSKGLRVLHIDGSFPIAS